MGVTWTKLFGLAVPIVFLLKELDSFVVHFACFLSVSLKSQLHKELVFVN